MAEVIPFPEDRARERERLRKMATYPAEVVIRRNTDDPPTVPDILIYVAEDDYQIKPPAYEGQRVWFWVCADCDIMTDLSEDFEGLVQQANEHWQQVHDGQP